MPQLIHQIDETEIEHELLQMQIHRIKQREDRFKMPMSHKRKCRHCLRRTETYEVTQTSTEV